MITLSLLIYNLILHIIKHNNKGITLKPYESHTATAELQFYHPSFPTTFHTSVQVSPFLPSSTKSFGHSLDGESSKLSKVIPCSWVPRSALPLSVGIHLPTTERSHPPVFLTWFHNLLLFFFLFLPYHLFFLAQSAPNYFFSPIGPNSATSLHKFVVPDVMIEVIMAFGTVACIQVALLDSAPQSSPTVTGFILEYALSDESFCFRRDSSTLPRQVLTQTVCMLEEQAE